MSDSPPDSSDPHNLLLVEDNPGDARLVEEALSESPPENILHTVSDGDEALDFLYQRDAYADAPRPDIVLLDWNLPGMSGADVLAELSDDPARRVIPIIVLTGSQSETDVVTAYTNCANACITKTGDPDAYITTIRVFEKFWLSVAELPNPNGKW
ncbi:response regulator [Natrinema sp. SYSU A 869]|uniref:response regulator n=1 Tax=Natrinema sp. SYSU A 869 TaxID=2871694 RepID=UPI001CA45567|nr:response regulator [Natrinema sp. SYSU A 869]